MDSDKAHAFLLMEYEKTFDSNETTLKSTVEIVKFYVGSSGIIVAAIPAIHAFLGRSAFGDVLFTEVIGACCLLAIIAGILAIVLLFKLRTRQEWCFSRLNLIRAIYLEPMKESNKEIRDYCSTRFGTTKEYTFSKKSCLSMNGSFTL